MGVVFRIGFEFGMMLIMFVYCCSRWMWLSEGYCVVIVFSMLWIIGMFLCWV